MKGPETRTRVHGSPGDDAKLVHKKQKVDHRHHDSEGAPSKSRRPEPAENEHGENGQLKQHPSENFDDFLKMLKDGVSLDEIREILRENGQDSSGSDESIVHRCADQMVYGPLEACRMCGGSLELSGLNYKCLGFISEWSKCSFSTRDPRRKNAAWKIPSGIKNKFIDEWSKKYRDPSKRPKRELPPTDKPFSGMTISLSGRMSRPQYVWWEEIEKHGGRVSNAIRDGVTCVVAPEMEIERGGSSKLVDATDRSIPIVRESWLRESSDKEKAQPLESYDMASELPGGHDIPWDRRAPEEEAAESLMAELKLYGKRGVYKDTELQEQG